MSRVHRFPLVLVLVLACGTSSAAETPPASAPNSPVEAAPDTAVPPADAAPNAEAADSKPPVRQEHIIYLPYENLRDVFEQESSAIVLPYAQFLEMWNRLVQGDRPPSQPPVNGVITRAAYVGSVQGELAHLEAALDVEVLSGEWARLPVEFGDAAIGSAQAENGSVLLRGVGEGQYELLVQGRGKHRIKLGLVIGVKSAAEGRSFSVRCPPVAVSHLELQIPETDLAVQVAPRLTAEPLSEQEDATGVRAVLGSTHQFTVSWQPRSGSMEEAAGLANVTDTIAVDVGDGVVHTQAIFDYEILRGSLGELLVEVPAGERLLDVQAPGIRDWQSEIVDDRQQVKVRLHAPVTEKIRLELHTETPLAAEAFLVGNVRAIGVARESGVLAVRSAEDVGLEFVLRESVSRIDAADAPESLRKPRTTFYKFFTPDHKLLVIASQLEPHVTVDSRFTILLDKARVTTRGEFQYRVSRSGIFSLALQLPAGLQIDEVRADALERFEVTPADGSANLTIYFTKKLLGDLTVTLIVSQQRDDAAGQVALPLPLPLNAAREQGLVAVIAPESLEVKTETTQLEGARAAAPAELTADRFQPVVPEASRLAAAFAFVARPIRIVQTISERPRRTEVVVTTVADVKEDRVQVTTALRYQIQFAGTDTLRIAVPAAGSDRLQIEGEGIKERRKGSPNVEGQTVEWIIVLHSAAIGERTFTAVYDQKLSIPDQGTRLVLLPIQPLDVDREAGEMAVLKERALAIDAEPRGLEEIDPRELTQSIGAAQPHLAYRYFQHPAELTLRVTKHELQEVVRTVVRRAYIEAVVTTDGPITVRARYDLRSSERQRLAVTLRTPRILGITVGGQTVAPEKSPVPSGGSPDDKVFLINVARGGDADEPFQIAIVFEMPLDGDGLGISDRLLLALPRFDEGVKFQQVYVRVWMPKDYRLVGDPEGYTSHLGVGLWDSRRITPVAENPDSWFPQDTSSFDFQVGGTPYLFSSLTRKAELRMGYWHIPTMTAIASLSVLVIGGALAWVSFDAKVFAVLMALFGLLFLGLFWPSLVNSWLLAARLGIAGVVALWLIAWLLVLRKTRGSWTPRSAPAPADRLPHEVPPGGWFQPSSASPPSGPVSPSESEPQVPTNPFTDVTGESGRGSDDK